MFRGLAIVINNVVTVERYLTTHKDYLEYFHSERQEINRIKHFGVYVPTD